MKASQSSEFTPAALARLSEETLERWEVRYTSTQVALMPIAPGRMHVSWVLREDFETQIPLRLSGEIPPFVVRVSETTLGQSNGSGPRSFYDVEVTPEDGQREVRVWGGNRTWQVHLGWRGADGSLEQVAVSRPATSGSNLPVVKPQLTPMTGTQQLEQSLARFAPPLHEPWPEREAALETNATPEFPAGASEALEAAQRVDHPHAFTPHLFAPRALPSSYVLPGATSRS